VPKEIFLKPWEECVGIYRGLRTSRTENAIVLSLANGRTLEILFPRASQEESILRELPDDMIEQKIGIVKTDTENPIRIRKILT